MLFVTAFPPNNRSGGQFFSYNALNDMKSYFSIDIIYFTYSGHEYKEIDGIKTLYTLKPSKWNCIRRPFIFPLFTVRFDKRLIKYINSVAEQYDVLYFDFSQVAYLAKYINHKCKIIRCHDVIAQKYYRVNRLVYWWSRRSESIVLNSAYKIFVPSKKDVQIIKSLYGLGSTYTNEYITHYQIPDYIENAGGYVLFGVWSRAENYEGLVWFIDNVIKSDKKRFEDKIYVMGSGLSEDFVKEELVPYGIEYLGFVDDCYFEISKRKAMIVPLFKGAGIKVKVLDSYSTGTPVIGTDVAFEGIPYVEGLENRVNSADEFIDLLNSYDEIEISEKRRMQKEFVRLYDNRHIGEMINEL